MAGYIGSKSSVTQVDGYNKTEADAEFLNDPASVITVSGSNVGIGTATPTRPLQVTDTTNDGSGGFKIESYLPTLEMDDISGGGTSFVLQHDGTNTLFKHDATERMRIDSAGRVTMPYQPSFRADTFTPITAVGTIIYTQAGHNIGSHYNTSNGKFTAPINGVYHFDFSVLMDASSSTAYVRVLFKINGSADTRYGDTLTGGNTGAFPNHSYYSVQMSHSFYLSANDTVEVHNDNSGGGTYHTGTYGSFSGYLIG